MSNRFWSGFFAVAALISFLPGTVHAQGPEELEVTNGGGKKKPAPATESTWAGDRLTEAMISAYKTADELKEKGVGYFGKGALLAANLKVGGRSQESFDLEGGKVYVFLGTADKSVNDVDIVVYDDEDNIVARDETSKPLGAAIFKAPRKGKYRAVLSLKDASNASAFVCLSVLQEDGRKVTQDSFTKSLATALFGCQNLMKAYSTINFHTGGNGWLLYAAVVPSGEVTVFEAKTFEGVQLFFTGSDKALADVRTGLWQGSTVSVKASGKDDDKFVMMLGATEGEKYRFGLGNNADSGNALLITAILDIPEDVVKDLANKGK